MAFTHKKFVIRSKVIWIGPPESIDEFANRQLSVENCDESNASHHLPSSTALVINVVPANRGNLATVIRSLAERALDHGLAVHIVADSDETQNHIAYVLRTFSMTGCVAASTRP